MTKKEELKAKLAELTTKTKQLSDCAQKVVDTFVDVDSDDPTANAALEAYFKCHDELLDLEEEIGNVAFDDHMSKHDNPDPKTYSN